MADYGECGGGSHSCGGGERRPVATESADADARPIGQAAVGEARGRRAAARGTWALALLLCVALLPLARAGTFLSGSVRWEKVEGKENTARFDVVTYWRRSFSPFKGGNAQPGDVLDIIAQQTVSLNYGDTEKLYFLEATVTNINEDEDWLEAVTTYEHTYEKPYQNVENVAVYDSASEAGDAPITDQLFKPVYTPWSVTVHGCCRYSTLANDADKPFVLNTTVNLVTSTRSPDARVLPTLSVSARGNFTAKFTAPAYSPQEVAAASVAASDRVLMFSWCPAQSPDHEDDFYWTRPAATEATIDAASGLVVLNFVDTAKQSVWHHLCVQAEVDGVISQVDFMVYVLAAGAAVPLCTTSVGSIGLPTYGYVGYRLSFEVHGSPAHGEGNVSIAVGYRSRMRDVVRGSLAVGNETSMAMTLEDSATAGGHAVARIEYLVPDWAGGWVAVCFVTYVTTAPTLKSAMRCVDLVLMKNEVTQLTTSTEREFMVFTDSGLPVPNTFRVREGQLLPLTVRAFKPPKDDSISLSILGDISKDNLLDHEEAAALYAAKNMTGLVPHGVTLQMVQAGHNASFRVDYRPSRAMTGTSVEVCVVARGSAGAFRTLEDTQLCVSVVVDRCLWTVQESENLVSIAQSIGVSWLQVWNYNKEELARPDLDLAAGQAIRVGQLYQVAKGDTLSSMAGRFSTSVDLLRRMNSDIDTSASILPGQIVCVTFNSCKSDIVA